MQLNTKQEQEGNVMVAFVKNNWCIIEPAVDLAPRWSTPAFFVISEIQKIYSIFKYVTNLQWYLKSRHCHMWKHLQSIHILCLKYPDITSVLTTLILAILPKARVWVIQRGRKCKMFMQVNILPQCSTFSWLRQTFESSEEAESSR